jgi:hypothetical protein
MMNSNERVIKHKISLLNLAVEVGGVKALLDKLRRKPNLKNRVDDVTEQAVLQYAIDFPAHGQTSWVHSFLQAAYAASS